MRQERREFNNLAWKVRSLPQFGLGPRKCLLLIPLLWILCIVTVFKARATSDLTNRGDSKEILSDAARGVARRESAEQRPHRLLSPEEQSILKQYPISPAFCDIYPVYPFLLVIVTSRVTGFELRQAIRQTWASVASPVCGVRVVFMVGGTINSTEQARLRTESEMHGDLIQSNQFEDTYTTASLKSLHSLQWAATFCHRSTYTAKVDDDNWLNLPKYEKFLQSQKHTDFAFGGIFWPGNQVVRYQHKNYVSREDYKEDYYPQYLSGMLYAYPTRLLHKLLLAGKEIPTILNEDVYIGGLLAGRANITRKQAPDYAWTPDVKDSDCLKRDKMCIHYCKLEQFYTFWKDPCYRYPQIC